MGNILSLQRWVGVKCEGIFVGGIGDACLDRTPSGVQSAIAQSSGADFPLIAVSLPSLNIAHSSIDHAYNKPNEAIVVVLNNGRTNKSNDGPVITSKNGTINSEGNGQRDCEGDSNGR